MILTESTLGAVVRFAAPWVWRTDERIAQKLLGFSATEAGSALDMLAAAELETDPRIRRLFFRHAVDEARHARMFKDEAARFAPSRRQNHYDTARAERQNLYQEMGRLRFLVFVHLAELRGEAHFRSLLRHFDAHPSLRALFERIAREERFHVSYTKKLLAEFEPRAVRHATARVRWSSAWMTWRRAGRQWGDIIARGVLAVVYATVVPTFALLQRVLEPERCGWQTPRPSPTTKKSMRRQF